MLTQRNVVDKIEILETGCIQVRTAIRIMEGQETVAQSFHRHVVSPGDDYSGEDEKVRAVCLAVHTPACIAAYKAAAGQHGA